MSKKSNYYYHCENLKEIEIAISIIERALRHSISSKDNRNEVINLKLLSYLITCWMEIRIYKIVEEPNPKTSSKSFSNHYRNLILKEKNLIDKWKTAVAVGFCNTYNIKYKENVDIFKKPLSVTARLRYDKLLSIIDSYLQNSITVRNRIAHGQWKYAFTNDYKNYSKDITTTLRTENYIHLHNKQKIFINLTNIINDLMVSPATFERDFDDHFGNLEDIIQINHKQEMKKYRVLMEAKYDRGKIKKKANISNI